MKPAVALLASACLALAGSVAVRAELLQPGNSRAQVNDAAVLHGLPQNLSDFGFFENQTEQQPGQGVTPYRLNTPLYSDGAEKLRFVYVPGGAAMKAQPSHRPM